MCGRTAQTQAAVRAAADILGAPQPLEEGYVHGSASNINHDKHQQNNDSPSELAADNSTSEQQGTGSKDNYNLSPGMNAMVFYKKDGKIVTESKAWGLITRHGSTNNPLPTGIGQHFSALMFNARSDTLYMKPTFGNLISKQQSCLVAVDGWFEWKQELKGKKQPYYVRAKHQRYCLWPGLWTNVATGRADEPWLTTFTILTTEAAPSLAWLHSRMPVCCFDAQVARQWLESPTQQVHETLLTSNYNYASTTKTKINEADDHWEWHTVTDEMTSLKFRSSKAIVPVQRESIKSFFAPATKKTESVPTKSTTTAGKRPASESNPIMTLSKKAKMAPKKASIQSFFSPKSKKS